MPFIGFCLAALNDFYHNVVADYSATPVQTTYWEELTDFIYPTGIILFLLMVLFKHLTNILFQTESDAANIRDAKGTDAEQAFYHGASLVFFGGVLYMLIYAIFGSPFRQLLT